MTKKSLRVSTNARRLIVLAYRSGPQELPFEELSEAILSQTLEGTRLKTRTALITLHSGGTKLAMGCRIHHGRDIFGGATVIMPAAVKQGHIQLIDEAVILPAGSLPEAQILSIASRLDDNGRIALGDIIKIDSRIDATPITGIHRDPEQIRVTLDTIWLSWDATRQTTISEIEAT